MEMTEQLSDEQVQKMVQEEIGPQGVIETGTGRRYLKVATKGKASLFMNVDLGGAHATVKKGNKEVPAIPLVIRFFQRGGDVKTFAPVLKARSSGSSSQIRLSKHVFPFCLSEGANPALVLDSWNRQDVTDQVIHWFKTVCEFVGAKPGSDVLLKVVVEANRPDLAADKVPEGFDVFSLELPKPSLYAVKTPDPDEDEDGDDGEEEESDEDDDGGDDE